MTYGGDNYGEDKYGAEPEATGDVVDPGLVTGASASPLTAAETVIAGTESGSVTTATATPLTSTETILGAGALWTTTTDWDDAQSETGVHHEQPASTDWAASDEIEKGLPTASPFGTGYLGYYPCAESSGTALTDVSGTNADGVYTGGTLATTGPLAKNAVSFSSGSEFADTDVQFQPTAGTSANFAISFWFRIGGSGDADLIDNWDNGGYGMYRNNNEELLFYNNLSNYPTTTTTVADDNWHFVYAHYESDGSGVIDLDGTEEDTVTNTGSPDWTPGGTHHFNTNGQENTGRGTDVDIAHVVFWDGILTPTERSNLYEAYV